MIFRKIKPVIPEKHHIDKRGETIFNKFPGNFRLSTFDSMTKIIGFQINLSFIGVGFSFEIFLGENRIEFKEESVI